jgi:gliding motility-associated-like protein
VPIIKQPVADYQECDDDTDGFTLFNLNGYASELLAGNPLPITSYTLNFYTGPGATNAIASNFTNTSNPQTIFVTATNIATGCTGPVGQFNIVVNPKPLATAPPPFDTCDTDGNNNGEFNFNLSNLEAAILTGQPNTDFSVTFYNTQADAQAGTNAIVDEAGYMAYTHTIWVRVENNITKCFRLVSFNATVEKLPEPTIFTSTGTNVICVDYNTQQVVRPLTLQVTNPTPGTYTYEWFEASNPTVVIGTNPTYDVTTADPTGATRTYTVKMTSVSPPQLGCSQTDSFQVIQSGQAVAVGVGYEVSNAFSDMQTITVTVTGYGSYLYSLDGGPRQTSNVFENVPLGVHTITVWDDKGGVASSCDPFQLTGVQIIDYPHYFTPNGDGINDTWNIVGLDKEINAKIYIFDRQGKLIKQISPASKGWDGTYNGNLMPSTDYWFTVDYPEAGAMKQFKAHFSLKR